MLLIWSWTLQDAHPVQPWKGLLSLHHKPVTQLRFNFWSQFECLSGLNTSWSNYTFPFLLSCGSVVKYNLAILQATRAVKKHSNNFASTDCFLLCGGCTNVCVCWNVNIFLKRICSSVTTNCQNINRYKCCTGMLRYTHTDRQQRQW